MIRSLAVALALAGAAVSSAQTTYRIQMQPVSWSDAPVSVDQAGALSLCSTAAAQWLALSKGRVVMACTAEPVKIFTTPFVGDCMGDWTGAIATASTTGLWPIYIRDVSGACPMYNANRGRPGAWLQGGGQIVHEFGHNLGLSHFGAVKCWQYPFDPDPWGACTFAGYSTAFVMGTGSLLGAPHADRLGVPPKAIELQRIAQAIDLSLGPVKLPRGDAITFWLEYQNGVVYVSYDGWPMFSSLDAVLADTLTPGDTFRDVTLGTEITRTGDSTVAIAILPTQPAAPTRTPTPPGPSPTPGPVTGPCGYWIFPPCPTATPTEAPTWTPTPSATSTPTSTITASPSSTRTPTAQPAEPTAAPSPTVPPPLPTPTIPGGHGAPGICGGGMDFSLLLIGVWMAIRRSRRGPGKR